MNANCQTIYNRLLNESYAVYDLHNQLGGLDVVGTPEWNTFVNSINNLPPDCITVFRGIDKQSDIYGMNELLNPNIEITRRVMNFCIKKWEHMASLQGAFGKTKKNKKNKKINIVKKLKSILEDIKYFLK